jgi:uncharacterized membrane protein YeaQ/YmgE (transglycosylase-associated protein family)
MLLKLISFLLIGLTAGWLAGLLSKGRSFGLTGNLVIGVLGALLGGFILNFVGFSRHGLAAALITAVFGALVLLWLLRTLKK